MIACWIVSHARDLCPNRLDLTQRERERERERERDRERETEIEQAGR